MSNVLRLILVDPNDTSRERLKRMLLGVPVVWLEAECSRYALASGVVGQAQPDLVVLDVDHDADKALQLLQSLQADFPECHVLVVSSATDGPLILKFIRAGAKEFLTEPLEIDELMAAIERIGAHRLGADQDMAGKHTVVAIAGATGGVGTTSVAVNLGCALASRTENKVVLIDLDLALGDADVLLDATPDYTLLDVAQNVTRLDFDLLKRSLTEHSSGLYLLPRPLRLQDAEAILAEELRRATSLLKATFSHVIFDLSKGFGPLDMLALEAAEHVFVVTQLDLPCLRNLARLLASLDNVEAAQGKTKVIVNRAGREHVQISANKLREIIGRDVFWEIPNDYKIMSEMRNSGVSLLESAPRSAIAQSFTALCNVLCDGEAPAASPTTTGGGWLSFWSGMESRERGTT